MKLQNRHIVLTGATSGIGGELARFLACENHVTVIGRASARASKLTRTLPEVCFIEADLAAPDLLTNPALLGLGAGQVDGLINCAAIQETPHFTDTAFDTSAIRREVATNFIAPCELTALLLPALLKAADTPFILNVNSGLALVPKPGSAVYCATKAALDSFSRSLRMQLEGTPVRVFQAFLPLVETPMTQGRGGRKRDARSVAIDILDGLESEILDHDIGQVAMLRLLRRVSPSLAQRIMRRSP